MPLDISSLGNAVQRLREGLTRYQGEPHDEQIRDGLIQRFEFTYELSHRTLRRFLAESGASAEDAAALSFADLIRAGAAQDLLRAGWPEWRRFRETRTQSSHTYDADAAAQVVAAIPDFLADAEHLHAELQRRVA